MLHITPTLSIPDDELTCTFIRASGPGGQNVNKVATAVQLRFDVLNSPSLIEEVKARLVKVAGNRSETLPGTGTESLRCRTAAGCAYPEGAGQAKETVVHPPNGSITGETNRV
jgi:hypothetical protein